MPNPARVSRRKALKLGAASAALPLVHIRTGRAAGRLSVGFWDHWVPAGNAVLKQQCDAWAAKNQVELNLDFITSVGNKLVLTQAAEAQAEIRQARGDAEEDHPKSRLSLGVSP